MPYTWNIGDALTAARLNQSDPETNGRLNTLDHNVLELFLENYFAGKQTPFQGLFFDGFSDSFKAEQLSDTVIEGGNKRLKLQGSSANVEYLIIAGAGGGGWNSAVGNSSSAGGGGAGGYLTASGHPLAAGSYPIVIGAGGNGGDAGDNHGDNGVNSTALGFTAVAGGGGGDSGTRNGNAGGSGGGGGATSGGGGLAGSGGAGTAGQGNAGGSGHDDGGSPPNGGGGGGGAGAVGGNASAGVAGAGGVGLSSSISGSPVTRAVGGAGIVNATGGANGAANTGNGGQGGQGGTTAGAGGSGIVIIRYLAADMVATGGTITTDGAFKIHTFTANGTFTITNITAASGFYKSIKTTFQQAKKSLKLWIVRNFSARFNLRASIASAATSLTLNGDQTGKFANTNTIDIYDANNFVRERKTLNAVPTNTQLFLDNFNRADSAIVGNSWTEDETNGTASILSNQLRLQSNAGGNGPRVHRVQTQGNDLILRAKFKVTTFSGQDETAFLVKAPGTNLNGLGLFISRGTNLISIRDNNVTKASASFTINNTDTWNIEFIVATDFSTEGRIWKTSESRPTNPTVSFGAFTPNASGTNWAIVLDTNIAATNDWLYDDFEIKENKTTLSFTPAIVNASGFGITAFVERVDVKPQVSLVNFNAADSFQDLTFSKSLLLPFTPKLLTANGNSQVDTAQFKFGTASLFNGHQTGDFVSTPDHGDFNFGADDFTIDMWVRFNSVAAANHAFISYLTSAFVNRAFVWYVTGGANLTFEYSTDGATPIAVNRAWSPANNVWYHIAISRSGADLKMFIDGVQLGATYNIGGDVIFDTPETFNIGGKTSVVEAINGWMDEIRVSNIARYTANFTPAVAAYTRDANTVLLIHADGTDGSRIFTDDVGDIFIEVEDEYTFTNATAEEDFKAKLLLSRVDTSLPVYAKRLGVSLTET